MATLDLNAVLRDAARRVLRPLGLKQKGRSRTWIDDHGWWLLNVEFQPSGFDRGSHLNVGSQHLWAERDFLIFENESRVIWDRGGQFVGLGDGPSGFDALVERAAERVLELRAEHGDGLHALHRLASLDRPIDPNDVWGLLSVGVAAGLTGDLARAASRFGGILRVTTSSSPGWQQALAADVAARWLPTLSDSAPLRAEAIRSVERCRELLRLPLVPVAFE